MKDNMKVEMEAHKNQQLERITEFMENNSKVSNSTGLKAENQRLKAQLDREIHYNRIMKSALEKYAFENTKMEIPKMVGYSLQLQNEVDLNSPMVKKPVYDGVEEVEVPYANDTSLALQVLKEIDNKE